MTYLETDLVFMKIILERVNMEITIKAVIVEGGDIDIKIAAIECDLMVVWWIAIVGLKI